MRSPQSSGADSAPATVSSSRDQTRRELVSAKSGEVLSIGDNIALGSRWHDQPRGAKVHSVPRDEERSLEVAAIGLRDALAAGLIGLFPVRSGPRAWGRSLRIDKSLASKCFRIVNSIDAQAIIEVLPGEKGLSMIYAALRTRGVPAARIAAVQSAEQVLRRAIELSPESRVGLFVDEASELMPPPRVVAAHRRARAAHARAAAVLYGIRAESSIATFVLSPSTHEGMVDVGYSVLTSGIVYTPSRDPWPICGVLAPFATSETTPEGHKLDVPLRSGGVTGAPPYNPIVKACSSDEVLSCVSIEATNGAGVLLLDRTTKTPRGGLQIALHEHIAAAGSMYRSDGDEICAMQVTVSLPLDRLVVQVVIDHRVRVGGEPLVAVFGRSGSPLLSARSRELRRMPLDGDADRCDPFSVPMSMRPAASKHRALLAKVLESQGVRGSDQSSFRVSMAHPVLSSTISLRWRLADKSVLRTENGASTPVVKPRRLR